MMQLDEILDDLKTRKTNLEKIQKDKALGAAFKNDQTKVKILKSITDLITKIEPLVKETKRLTDLKPKASKFSNDVDKLNANRKQFINAFNALKNDCSNVKADSKDKDFSEIKDNSIAYVALNDFEKL